MKKRTFSEKQEFTWNSVIEAHRMIPFNDRTGITLVVGPAQFLTAWDIAMRLNFDGVMVIANLPTWALRTKKNLVVGDPDYAAFDWP